jgi:hypothetical protein
MTRTTKLRFVIIQKGEAFFKMQVTDLWLCIYDFAAADTIFALYETSKYLRNVGEIARNRCILSQRIRVATKAELGHEDEFWAAMVASESILSGSFLLTAIQGDERWQANDLDIYRFEPKRTRTRHEDPWDGDRGLVMRYLYPKALECATNQNYNERMKCRVYTYYIGNDANVLGRDDRMDNTIFTSHTDERLTTVMNPMQSALLVNANAQSVYPYARTARHHTCQVVGVEKERNETLVQHVERCFDLDFLRSAYDGKNLYITRKRSIMTRTSVYDRSQDYSQEIDQRRIDKYRSRGFTIIVPDVVSIETRKQKRKREENLDTDDEKEN